jgi:hypothetical protein
MDHQDTLTIERDKAGWWVVYLVGRDGKTPLSTHKDIEDARIAAGKELAALHEATAGKGSDPAQSEAQIERKVKLDLGQK